MAGRLLLIGALAVAMLAIAAPLSAGDEGASTDEVRFTTDVPGASTGVFATEEFNTRDSKGQLKRLRHSRVEFPAGTVLGQYGVEVCTATESDFKSKGLSACPDSTRLGTGHATVVTTGTPVEVGPIPLDVTAFNEPGKFLMIFTSNGSYVSQQPLYAHGTVQEADVKPSCVVPTESDPCPSGEFVPKSLTVDVPPHSRTINGRVYNSVTTPPTCPAEGWVIADVHTFSDGSKDPFANRRPCRAVTSSASVVGARALRLGVRPATVPAGRRSCLRFRATGPGGGPVAGVKVRFGRARGRSGTGGALRLCERPLRRGMRKAVAAKAGYVPAAARVRVR